TYKVIALVYSRKLLADISIDDIELVEFPRSRKSYFNRLWYEYIVFRTLFKANDVAFWLSLNDITPRLNSINQAVYCHNPSPFRKPELTDLVNQPSLFFFSIFY